MKSILGGTSTRIVTILLLVEIVAFYGYPKSEVNRAVRPLNQIPATTGAWRTVNEYPMESEVQAVLKADDTLNRLYTKPAEGGNGQSEAALFIAFFKTQSTGVAPHSPRNCLPGSGWIPGHFEALPISIDGLAEPIKVNRYLIERGQAKSLVLYWYQTGSRVVGSEYEAKLHTVSDRFFHSRSDTSLVRIIVEASAIGEEKAQAQAVEFARVMYPQITQFLPK